MLPSKVVFWEIQNGESNMASESSEPLENISNTQAQQKLIHFWDSKKKQGKMCEENAQKKKNL